MHCGKCGAGISETDRFCGKCGAVQEMAYAPGKASSRIKLLAAAAIAILILAGLFGSGLIQQMLRGVPLSLPGQATGTSSTSSSSVTVSQVSAETSNIASSAETSSSTSRFTASPPSVFSSIPNWPTAVGCYHYDQSMWQNVTCLSPEAVLRFGGLPGPFLGIISNNGANPFAPATPLTYGIVMVNIHNFGDEFDSFYRTGAYSIQLNTNFFSGNNGHRDWVQFVYQDFCGSYSDCGDVSRFCVWNIDVTIAAQTKDQAGYNPTCVGPGAVSLSEVHAWQWEIFIEGFVFANGNLTGCGWLNGGVWCVVAPDQYGLASRWFEASGGIMGAGGGSKATFSGTWVQTNIGVNSCPNLINGWASLWLDCGGPAISATMTPRPGSQVTAERNSLTQYDEWLTSYYSRSHWWLSSASGCDPALGQDIYGPGCTQFVDYGEAFGHYNIMLFTVDIQPPHGTVNAGNDTSTTVNVVSVNGVQVGPITMRVSGLTITEDLSGKTCTFSIPLQPGSSCTYTMNIHAPTIATPGSYDIRITGTQPPNALPPPLRWGMPQLSNSATYNLVINPSIPPSPVIVSPVFDASLHAGSNTMVGYARSNDPSEPGWVPCGRMQFQITFTDGSTIMATPTEDPTFQQTGYCDATVTFTVLGPTIIWLSAANLAGVQGTTSVAVKIISEEQPIPFTFAVSVTPSIYAMVPGGTPKTFTVTVTATGGTPQPVQLIVSGLPQGATYTLSSNPVTPTTTLILTITVSSNTPLGSYTIQITGTGGGSTASATIQLAVANLG